jgi:hypothetical protein
MPEINFNAAAIPESRTAVPAGDYMVWVKGSKCVDGDRDDQQQQQFQPNPHTEKKKLVLDIEILQPESVAGQVIHEGYWMRHPNPKAVEVSNRLLANVCRAVNQMSPSHSEQLHQIPFWARLDVKELDSGALVNEIRAVWSTQSQAPPQMKPRAQKPQQQQFVPGAQSGFMPPQTQQPWQQAPQQAPMAPQLGQPVQQPQYQAPMAQPLQQHPPQGHQTQWAQQPGQPPFPPQQSYEQPAPAAAPAQPQQGGFQPPVKQAPPPWAQQPGQNGTPF